MFYFVQHDIATIIFKPEGNASLLNTWQVRSMLHTCQ
jgi:hypothetical protein